MVLVIIGHVFSQEQFSINPICDAGWKWIYLFHMPLFIFISGYLSRKKNVKQFLSSCWKLLEPLIIFQVLFRGYEFFSSGTFSWRLLLTPWWVLWYLLSLLFWRSLLQIIPSKLLSHSMLIIMLAFIISLIVGFFPLNRFLSLQRTFAFIPFFIGGYCMRGKDLFIASKYRTCCVLFLLFTFLFPVFFDTYLGDLNHADPYSHPHYVYFRLLVWGLSIPMSVAFVSICPNLLWTAKQGRFSMQYYIFHAVFIFILIRFIVRFGLPVSLFAAVLYTFGIVMGIGVLLKSPIIAKITNPSSLLKKSKTNNC